MEQPVRNLAWWARHHFRLLWWASFVVWLCPVLWLTGWWWTEGRVNQSAQQALHLSLNFTGRWALIMLLVTLSVTPARRFSLKFSQFVHARFGRRLSDWNWLIK